jgi:hypothetical protein
MWKLFIKNRLFLIGNSACKEAKKSPAHAGLLNYYPVDQNVITLITDSSVDERRRML